MKHRETETRPFRERMATLPTDLRVTGIEVHPGDYRMDAVASAVAVARWLADPGTRERIARVIDPLAFDGRGTPGWQDTYGETRREVAFDKADAIIALAAEAGLAT